jgi:hypothetical protein
METKTPTHTTLLPNTLENFWTNRPGLKEKCDEYDKRVKRVKPSFTFTSTMTDVTPKGYGPSNE